MSRQNSMKGGNIQSPNKNGKYFTSLNNNELKELMINNELEDIYYLISDSYINGLDLSLLKYEELNSELKIKNLNQRNKLFKFINRELAHQMKLNLFYEEKKFVIQIDNRNELDVEGLLKFIKESKRFHTQDLSLVTSDNEILSPKMKISDLLIFNPETYQNLYLVHNLEKTKLYPAEDTNFKNIYQRDRFDSKADNRRTNSSNNLIEQNYGLDTEKANYSNNAISDLNNKYDTNFEYGYYNRSVLNNERKTNTNLPENSSNLGFNRKENERFREYENNENRFSDIPRSNYSLKDRKEEEMVMGTTSAKNDLGNYQQQQQTDNIADNEQRFQNSESRNIIKGDYDNYRFNDGERKELAEFSSDNNTIRNARERFNDKTGEYKRDNYYNENQDEFRPRDYSNSNANNVNNTNYNKNDSQSTYNNYQDPNNKRYFANKYNVDLDNVQNINSPDNNTEDAYTKERSEKSQIGSRYFADKDREQLNNNYSSDFKDEMTQGYNYKKFNELEDNPNPNSNAYINKNPKSYLDNMDNSNNNFRNKYKSFNSETMNFDRKYNFESNLKSNDEFKDKEQNKEFELNSYNNSRIGSSIGNTTALDDRQSNLNLNLNSNKLNSVLDAKREFDNKSSENKKEDFAALNKKFSSEKRSFRYEHNKGNLNFDSNLNSYKDIDKYDNLINKLDNNTVDITDKYSKFGSRSKDLNLRDGKVKSPNSSSLLGNTLQHGKAIQIDNDKFFKNFDSLNKKITNIKTQFGNHIGLREKDKKDLI